MTCSPLPPLDGATAERIARVAVRPGARTLIGPRVVAGLLARITELVAERTLLRRELDALQSAALEQARLRAHAMWAQHGAGGEG